LCYMPCPSHPPSFDNSNYTWQKVQVMTFEYRWLVEVRSPSGGWTRSQMKWTRISELLKSTWQAGNVMLKLHNNRLLKLTTCEKKWQQGRVPNPVSFRAHAVHDWVLGGLQGDSSNAQNIC
jgi:hypothetical protein